MKNINNKPYARQQLFPNGNKILETIANLGNQTTSDTDVKILSCIPLDVSDLQERIICLERDVGVANQIIKEKEHLEEARERLREAQCICSKYQVTLESRGTNVTPPNSCACDPCPPIPCDVPEEETQEEETDDDDDDDDEDFPVMKCKPEAREDDSRLPKNECGIPIRRNTCNALKNPRPSQAVRLLKEFGMASVKHSRRGVKSAVRSSSSIFFDDCKCHPKRTHKESSKKKKRKDKERDKEKSKMRAKRKKEEEKKKYGCDCGQCEGGDNRSGASNTCCSCKYKESRIPGSCACGFDDANMSQKQKIKSGKTKCECYRMANQMTPEEKKPKKRMKFECFPLMLKNKVKTKDLVEIETTKKCLCLKGANPQQKKNKKIRTEMKQINKYQVCSNTPVRRCDKTVCDCKKRDKSTLYCEKKNAFKSDKACCCNYPLPADSEHTDSSCRGRSDIPKCTRRYPQKKPVFNGSGWQVTRKKFFNRNFAPHYVCGADQYCNYFDVDSLSPFTKAMRRRTDRKHTLYDDKMKYVENYVESCGNLHRRNKSKRIYTSDTCSCFSGNINSNEIISANHGSCNTTRPVIHHLINNEIYNDTTMYDVVPVKQTAQQNKNDYNNVYDPTFNDLPTRDGSVAIRRNNIIEEIIRPESARSKRVRDKLDLNIDPEDIYMRNIFDNESTLMCGTNKTISNLFHHKKNSDRAVDEIKTILQSFIKEMRTNELHYSSLQYGNNSKSDDKTDLCNGSKINNITVGQTLPMYYDDRLNVNHPSLMYPLYYPFQPINKIVTDKKSIEVQVNGADEMTTNVIYSSIVEDNVVECQCSIDDLSKSGSTCSSSSDAIIECSTSSDDESEAIEKLDEEVTTDGLVVKFRRSKIWKGIKKHLWKKSSKESKKRVQLRSEPSLIESRSETADRNHERITAYCDINNSRTPFNNVPVEVQQIQVRNASTQFEMETPPAPGKNAFFDFFKNLGSPKQSLEMKPEYFNPPPKRKPDFLTSLFAKRQMGYQPTYKHKPFYGARLQVPSHRTYLPINKNYMKNYTTTSGSPPWDLTKQLNKQTKKFKKNFLSGDYDLRKAVINATSSPMQAQKWMF